MSLRRQVSSDTSYSSIRLKDKISSLRTLSLSITVLISTGLCLIKPLAGQAGLTPDAIAQGAPPPNDANKEDINNFVTKLDDMGVTIHVSSYDLKELEKIGSSFKTTYSVRNLTLVYKQPDKMRLDAKSPVMGDAVLILNGSQYYVSVPRLKLVKTEDLKSSPSRRQSMMEYTGIIMPDALEFMDGRFVKNETLNGNDMRVFDMNYKGTSGLSHFRVWIDPKTHMLSKRAWYDHDNKLKATFYYLEPHEVAPGIWIPSRMEIKNSTGATAAVTNFEDIQVNQGLPDTLFAPSQS